MDNTAPRLSAIHASIRSRFPLLDRDAEGRRRIYLNSGAGSLMVGSAARAMSEASGALNPMPGAVCPGEIATGEFHAGVRSIAADFLNAAAPEEISFHLSATAALFDLAFGLRSVLDESRNLVVTDLDHMANVSPWEDLWGRARGCEVRRARVAPDGTLDLDHLLSLADGRTGLVAVTMASNGFGSIVPLAEVAAGVRRINPDALICVDAVHHALHGPIDVRALGIDLLVFSGYKVFGPMLGVCWGRRELLDRLNPYRVSTNKNEPPWKFEMGMLNNANLAALEAALRHLLWIADELGAPADLPRPARFAFGLEAVAEYERDLSRRVLDGFARLDPGKFRSFGIVDSARVAERDPTFAFEIAGQTAAVTKRRLWESGSIQIADGNHYSAAVVRHLRKDALCRASFAHYDSPATIDRFLDALGKVVADAEGAA